MNRRHLFLTLLFVSFLASVGPTVAQRETVPNDGAVPSSDSRLTSTGSTTRVSVASDGTQGNNYSGYFPVAISADGSYVAFASRADNLVSADTNNAFDVFVHDRQTGQTTRVSVASDGSEGNGRSDHPAISADGRYVSFESSATNLVAKDTNRSSDVFVHDRQTGQTKRVSVSSESEEGHRNSSAPSISADGRFIAFLSYANNLVSGDTNSTWDVFVHDQQTSTTRRVSVATDGTQANGHSGGPSISANGQYVAFYSDATNLVPGDTNDVHDVFVHERSGGSTFRVSVASDGTQGNSASSEPAISANGRYVAFNTYSSNLVDNDTNSDSDVFLHDRHTSQTYRVSIGIDGEQINAPSGSPSISDDGHYIAFQSSAPNLLPDDTNHFHVYVYNVPKGLVSRVSVSSDGVHGNAGSDNPAISGSGRFVAFPSVATNLVSGDTNETQDVFVHGPINSSWLFIGGKVTDATNNPLAGVRISTDSSNSAITDSLGNYRISGVVTGTHTITPKLDGYNFSPASRTITVPPDAEGQDFIASEVDGIDLSIDEVTPIQVIEGQDLVRGKATGVKVVVRKTGDDPVSNVPVRISLGDFSSDRFFVYEPNNMDSHHALHEDNTDYPLDFPAGDGVKTIYFFHDDLTPTDTHYQVQVTVDAYNVSQEADETNNTRQSDIFNVYDVVWSEQQFVSQTGLYIHYFPTDWESRPLGPFYENVQYSSDFVSGAFPVNDDSFIYDESTLIRGSTALYQDDDGRIVPEKLAGWMKNNLLVMRLAHPMADRFVAAVPPEWFSNTLTEQQADSVGISLQSVPELVISETHTPEHPNGSSIVAHELGHTYGLHLDCEDYDEYCDQEEDERIGSIVEPGLWVERRIPMVDREIYAFMGSHTMTHEYWAKEADYTHLFQNHGIAFTMTPQTAQAILATGTFSATGAVSLDDWYLLPEAHISTFTPGPYTFVYQDGTGHTIHEIPFDVSFNMEDAALQSTAFAFTLPYVAGTERIIVENEGATVAQKDVSAHTPEVTVLSPNGGEELEDQTTISWTGNDADGDSLTYTLLLSSDGGETWDPIAGELTSTSYKWNLADLPSGEQYLIKVVATDGFLTAEDSLDAPFAITGENSVYLPMMTR